MTPYAALRAAVAADPGRPLLTMYDDASGERVELSAATADNWVAKSAGLLRDGLGVAPGERVALLLPAHWQTACLLLAVSAVGAVAVLDDAPPEPVDVDVAFVTPELLDVVPAAREVLALGLLPLGRPLPPGSLPVGVADYASEVPVHPDRWSPDAPPSALVRVAGEPVLDLAAATAAAAAALTREDRVLSTAGWSSSDELVARLLGPLAAGAGVVLVRHARPDAAQRIGGPERVTRTA